MDGYCEIWGNVHKCSKQRLKVVGVGVTVLLGWFVDQLVGVRKFVEQTSFPISYRLERNLVWMIHCKSGNADIFLVAQFTVFRIHCPWVCVGEVVLCP